VSSIPLNPPQTTKRHVPSVLILGSRFDLTCDYVVAQLRGLGCSYLRLNTEDLSESNVKLDPIRGTLVVQLAGTVFHLEANELKSVYYRRPVFLRDYDAAGHDPAEQFQRHQWATFIRSLMVFYSSQWINHPAATYYAEHKAVQLRIAYGIGFAVPETVVTNQESLIGSEITRDDDIVIKGLDTVLVRYGINETFGFTNIIKRHSLIGEEISSAPVMFQEPISNKLDLRVTVIGSDVFAVSILADGKPIKGDWRQQKDKASFVPFTLPSEIQDKCILLLKKLGLVYGAIDLALEGNQYYFLEINPTGEWAWLVDSAKLPIDIAIAKCLAQTV
jgi:glutathione synthase/RimK-type ligase-like ATP-grasp enzyme